MTSWSLDLLGMAWRGRKGDTWGGAVGRMLRASELLGSRLRTAVGAPRRGAVVLSMHGGG
jgi:hypothetical protein